MNYFTSTKSKPFVMDITLLAIRIFVGFAMLSHGFPKLQQLFSGEEIQFYDFLGMGSKITLIFAVFAEFVCSIFIILGLFTRLALFFLIFTMIVAAFFVHSLDVFSKREISLLYLSIYLVIFASGPGKFSIDQMISKRRDSDW